MTALASILAAILAAVSGLAVWLWRRVDLAAQRAELERRAADRADRVRRDREAEIVADAARDRERIAAEHRAAAERPVTPERVDAELEEDERR